MIIAPLQPLFQIPIEVATSAKQLELEVIPMKWAKQFNFDWHSQLPDIGGTQFGDVQIAHALTFDGGVYGVAIWTRPIAGNRMSHPSDHLVELRRLAIPEYAPRFAASRMLGRMERWFRVERSDICRLLSYQMTDVHSGTIYKAANWSKSRQQISMQSWLTHSRRPAADIATAPKIRWERQLHKCED